MAVYYQRPSNKTPQQIAEERRRYEEERHRREAARNLGKTATFIGINAIIGIPLFLIFGFTIPLWSIAISTICFAINVYLLENLVEVGKWRSIFYSSILYVSVSTIGVLLFGRGGLSSIFKVFPAVSVINIVLSFIWPFAEDLFEFISHKVLLWIGLAVSAFAVTSIASAVFAFGPVIQQKIAPSLQSDLDMLSQNLVLTDAHMSSSTVIHPFVAKGRAFLYVTNNGQGQILTISSSLYSNPYERIVSLLTRTPMDVDKLLATKTGVIRDILTSNKLLTGDDPSVVVVDGNMQSVNFNSEFPSSIVFRSASTDVTLIEQNINHVFALPAVSPANTRIIDATPANKEGLENLQIDGNWNDWSGVHKKWQSVISQHGYAEQAGNTTAEVLNAVASGSNVLIIVAHGNSSEIFFPDGSRLNIKDFEKYREQIQRDHPLIILFSCETARIDGTESYASNLVKLGARAVIAPVTEIGAISSSSLLNEFLRNSAAGLNPIEALEKAAQDSDIYNLENWIGFIESARDRN